MILIRRWLYWFLAVFVCLGTVGAGIMGYLLIKTAAADSAQHARFMAEQFLFITLTGAMLLAVIHFFVLFRSIRLDRELDKIVELNRFQDFSPERSMKKLGLIGKKITALYYQLNTLNEKKSLKISAQSELAAFLISNSELPLAVSDVTGILLYASSGFAEKLGKLRTELIGSNIDALIPDISVRSIDFELGKTHRMQEVKSGKSTVTCYPLHNRLNDLSYIVFVLDKKAVYPEETKFTESPEIAHPTRLQKMFSRFLNRREPEERG